MGGKGGVPAADQDELHRGEGRTSVQLGKPVDLSIKSEREGRQVGESIRAQEPGRQPAEGVCV